MLNKYSKLITSLLAISILLNALLAYKLNTVKQENIDLKTKSEGVATKNEVPKTPEATPSPAVTPTATWSDKYVAKSSKGDQALTLLKSIDTSMAAPLAIALRMYSSGFVHLIEKTNINLPDSCSGAAGGDYTPGFSEIAFYAEDKNVMDAYGHWIYLSTGFKDDADANRVPLLYGPFWLNVPKTIESFNNIGCK